MKNEEFYGEHLLHMENTKDKAVILAKFAAEFSGQNLPGLSQGLRRLRA